MNSQTKPAAPAHTPLAGYTFSSDGLGVDVIAPDGTKIGGVAGGDPSTLKFRAERMACEHLGRHAAARIASLEAINAELAKALTAILPVYKAAMAMHGRVVEDFESSSEVVAARAALEKAGQK